MNKLEAWKLWLKVTDSSDGADELSLFRSSHGKTFSFAWDRAIDALGLKLRDMNLEIKNVNAFNVVELLETNIEVIPFDVRSQNALRAEGIETLGQLLLYTEQMLLRVPNLGRKSIDRIRDELHTIGFKIGELPFRTAEGNRRPYRTESSLKPRKKRENKMTAIMAKAKKRRDAIYRRWNNGELSYGDLAIEFGVTPGRIHQIIKRADREHKKALHESLQTLENASQVAKSLPVPPWLKESPNESSDDQSSGAASA